MATATVTPLREIDIDGYIKPVYVKDILKSYALCRTDTPLVDGDIVEHFGIDYSGKEIREAAKEFYGMENLVWGRLIDA